MSDFQQNYPLLNAAGPILYVLADLQCNGRTITFSGSKLVASTTEALGEHVLSNDGADGVATVQNEDPDYYSAFIFLNDNGEKIGAAGIGNTNSTVGLRNQLFIHGNTIAGGSFVTVPPPVNIGHDFAFNSGSYLPHNYIVCTGSSSSNAACSTTIYGLHASNATGQVGVFVANSGNVGVFTNTLVGGMSLTIDGSVALSNAASNRLDFGTFGLGAPANDGAGQKLHLYGTQGAIAANDYAIGVEGGAIWFANDQGSFKFYDRTTNHFTITNEGVLSPCTIPSSTVAGAGSAATAAQWKYITNESGGAVPAFSDGTNWRRCTDRAIIS